MATFGYGRVSTKDQTTENQRLEIERAGFKVDYWFNDEGVSGSSHASQRPQFRALLGQIRNEETLIVSKLHRLGRDAEYVLSTMKTLSERKIKVFVIQLGQLSLTSPVGKLMFTILSAVAAMECDFNRAYTCWTCQSEKPGQNIRGTSKSKINNAH